MKPDNQIIIRAENSKHHSFSLSFQKKMFLTLLVQVLKAYVSQEILNWHSLRHSHSAVHCTVLHSAEI